MKRIVADLTRISTPVSVEKQQLLPAIKRADDRRAEYSCVSERILCAFITIDAKSELRRGRFFDFSRLIDAKLDKVWMKDVSNGTERFEI